jgi:hypothetical protein
MTPRRKLTPHDIAESYGCGVEKVLRWIHAGELRAINVATRRDGGKPRWLIDPADLAAFEASRAVTPPVSAPRRRRAASDVTAYV